MLSDKGTGVASSLLEIPKYTRTHTRSPKTTPKRCLLRRSPSCQEGIQMHWNPGCLISTGIPSSLPFVTTKSILPTQSHIPAPIPILWGVSKVRHKWLRAKLTGVRGVLGADTAGMVGLRTASVFPPKAGLWIQSVTRRCYPCLGYTRRKCTRGDLLIDTHLVRREKRYNPKCLEPSLSAQTSAHCSRITFELLQSTTRQNLTLHGQDWAWVIKCV